MAEFSTRRVVVIAALAGALVGGAVASGVAAASTSTNHDSPTSSAGGGAVTTAEIVRTDLSSTVQVGGSIGFNGTYTVAAPSGTSAQQVDTAEQAVTQAEDNLQADTTAADDDDSTNAESQAAAQQNVDTAQSTLSTDQAAAGAACANSGASSPTCSQDIQRVQQDESQLNQAEGALGSGEANAKKTSDMDVAKVVSDRAQLASADQALTLAQQTATNPGTTYTYLPSVGDVIKQDQPVYSVSNEPVPLLYGSIAAYRAFDVDMADGSDVGELSRDLIALGYGAGLTQSNHYSSATAAAVQRWQTALGLLATGEILLGQVVFEPGPIRVTSVTPSVGESLGGGGGGAAGDGGGTVLTATSTTPIVTVDLDVSQEYLVKPGNAVSVVLPNGTSTVGGHIETVGNVATCPSGGGTGLGGGSSAGQSPCSSAGSNSNSTPTVTVTITLDSTSTLATLDQAPVNVNITTQQVDNVLAVPVNALLALADGGFGVDVVAGNTSRLVGVTPGLSENTLVQVSGSGIAAGTRVEVPSS